MLTVGWRINVLLTQYLHFRFPPPTFCSPLRAPLVTHSNMQYDDANAVMGRMAMPTVLRIGRFRFYFFSNEGQEPPHIHVQVAGDQAKFWLNPILLAANYGFAARELNEIERIIADHQTELLEAWHDYFDQP